MKLSGIVITHNEAKNIERCLKSLLFCDEVIVVDSYSQDATCEIAKKFTDRIFQREWPGYASQKNFATSQARGTWALSIDADEEVTPELKEEILKIIQENSSFDSYTIPRKTLHSGRWIKHGGWYPNRLVRFYKPNKGMWVGTELHERWETQGTVGILQEHILHHSFDSFFDQIARNNRYSSLGAQELKSEGKKFHIHKPFTTPFTKFVETFFVKGGILDGLPGFFISVSAAYSIFVRWMKLWELEQQE